jgi:lincosamide nucleotidyltransferase A/C/D/E
MDAHGVTVWLDGGWAVDACLGEQTRPHADLDIVIQRHHEPIAVRALGYAPVPRGDTTDWNYVLGDGAGREIDFHVIVFDEDGRGVMGPEAYPAGSLDGTGTIRGRTVRCVTPEALVAFHTGYAVDADDWADVSALCARFGLPIPDDYRAFR